MDCTAYIAADGFAPPGTQGSRPAAHSVSPGARMALLAWQAEWLARQGCSEICILPGDGLGAKEIMEYLGDGYAPGARITYFQSEYCERDSGGGWIFPDVHSQSSHCLFVDGTLFFDIDLRLLYSFYESRAGNAGAALALKYRDVSGGARVSLSEAYLADTAEVAVSGEGYVFGGLCLVSRAAFRASSSFPRSARFYGVPLAGRFFDLLIPDEADAFACAFPEYFAETAPRVSSPGTGSGWQKRPAIFLDRDGVLLEDSGYIRDPDTVVYKEDVLRGLAGFSCIRKREVLLIIVSNQAGIAKGLLSVAEAEAVNERLARRMLDFGLEIAGVWYCPYHEEGVLPEYTRASLQRKPQPGMILLAAESLGVDISRSLMVGDKESDRIALPYLETYLLSGRSLPEGVGGSAAGLMHRIAEKFCVDEGMAQ